MTIQTVARWTLRLASYVAIAAVSSCGTRAVIALEGLPKPPLTAGLGGTWDAVSTEFDQRVRASFPIGSTVESMGRTLERQGFSHDWSCSSEQEHLAIRNENDIGGVKSAYIQWRSDDGGRITSIKGSYVLHYSL